MAAEQLEAGVMQPHIKAPVNPRPHLPQMPQLSAHTHTAQPQSDQNRTGHGLATNPIHPIDLDASSGSPAPTQVECCDLMASFMVTTEM